MSAKENIHYSSEYGQEIQLKCVFIHNSIANVQSLSSTYNDMLQQSFHKLFTHLLNKYNDIRIEDYHLMVVHPWQFEHILLSQYQQELDEQLIIPIDMTLPYYAGLSFRTLMPKYLNYSRILNFLQMFILLGKYGRFLNKQRIMDL